MKEIKVRKYIRTDNGIIEILKGIEKRKNDILYCFNYKGQLLLFPKRFIVNQSQNISELIEVGDYVNGMIVRNIGENYILVADKNGYYEEVLENDIKSIVTKEQFSSVEYRLEE